MDHSTEPAVTHRVLELPPSKPNPRNSEGSFIRLRDGRVLFVYTHYTGGTQDEAEAHLAGRWSDNGGRKWTAEDQVIVPNPPGKNIMSVSLLRLLDGRIALFYLHKVSHGKTRPGDWRVLMRISEDEARSWSEPTQCSPTGGWFVMNNDRPAQLRSGRIVLPVAHNGLDASSSADEAAITCILSDDAGVTWRMKGDRLNVPRVWTQEPGVIELKDGRVMMFCRTQMGCQYVTHSDDGGEHWLPLRPSNIVSSLSPACIKRIPQTGDLLMIWNPVDDPWRDWDSLRRSPLCSAVSRDEGRTWEHQRTLASDPTRWYCYTAIAFVDDHVLLAHSAGSGKTHARLAVQQITRLPLTWFYDG